MNSIFIPTLMSVSLHRVAKGVVWWKPLPSEVSRTQNPILVARRENLTFPDVAISLTERRQICISADVSFDELTPNCHEADLERCRYK